MVGEVLLDELLAAGAGEARVAAFGVEAVPGRDVVENGGVSFVVEEDLPDVFWDEADCGRGGWGVVWLLRG